MIEKLKSRFKNNNFRTSVVVVVLLFLGSYIYLATSSGSLLFKSNVEQASINETLNPSPTSETKIMGVATAPPSYNPNLSKSPTPAIKLSPSANPSSSVKSSITSVSNSQSSPTPQPSSISQTASSPTPAPTPEKKQVNMEIQSPDGNSSFQIDISEGMNVCDVLQKAKDQGKVKSITFDDQYLASYNSKYVYEINGFKNNWTFKVNGNSPLGCSLYQVKNNDSIVWEFN